MKRIIRYLFQKKREGGRGEKRGSGQRRKEEGMEMKKKRKEMAEKGRARQCALILLRGGWAGVRAHVREESSGSSGGRRDGEGQD